MITPGTFDHKVRLRSFGALVIFENVLIFSYNWPQSKSDEDLGLRVLPVFSVHGNFDNH